MLPAKYRHDKYRQHAFGSDYYYNKIWPDYQLLPNKRMTCLFLILLISIICAHTEPLAWEATIGSGVFLVSILDICTNEQSV